MQSRDYFLMLLAAVVALDLLRHGNLFGGLIVFMMLLLFAIQHHLAAWLKRNDPNWKPKDF